MSHADKDALIVLLFGVLAEMEARLNALEHQVDKNSKNSSKPPSSDGLKKGAAQPRTRGAKPSGGQPGHGGSNRQLSASPDEVLVFRPTGQCSCGLALDTLDAILVERRQQIDIPPPRAHITEYQKWGVQCRCGQYHAGVFPDGIAPHVSYGARLKAYAVGLVQGHFVALERVAEILDDQYGIRPSSGSLQKWVVQVAEHLRPAYDAQCPTITGAEVAHFDESGIRVNGQLQWLHVAATDSAVHYSTHPKRGTKGMDAAGILPAFTGIAVHDCWQPYWHYPDISHALCNAHLLRELNYVDQLTGQAWPVALRNVLVDGKKAVKAALEAGQTLLAQETLATLENRYDAQITLGLEAFPVSPPVAGKRGRTKQHPATNLLLRLKTHKEAILRFLTDWRVPFDNNRAERAVRCIKVKLKVTGGFRASGGSQAFCIIRSIWETNKLHHQNPFDTLRVAFGG
ncbi:MAG: IS66 family transposase [Thiolinea sp.]